MTPTLLFYCNAMGDDVRAERAISTDSPASTRKVVEVSRAVRSRGNRAMIVSMARGRVDGSGRYHRGRVGRLRGIPVIYGPMLHRRGLSELLTIGWLLLVAARLARRFPQARHLFYNQFTAYVPALIWLRLRRRHTLCDIEDGPTSRAEQAKLPTRGNAPPGLFARLISDGALLACQALRHGTAIAPTTVCYGAVDPGRRPSLLARPAGRQVVIMTGMFDHATGSELLIRALEAIARDPKPYAGLCFEFAGFGPMVAPLTTTVAGLPVDAVVHGRLDDTDYRALLARAAVGLSLKAVDGPYANTTFPSKTVEYAQSGLCLVATDISDVCAVFGDTARYLTKDDPEQLLACLRWIAANPEGVRTAGAAGRRVVEQQLSYTAVGDTLTRFLFGSSSR